MATVRVAAERIIPASAAELYALLADYHVGHPSILPPAFSDFTVLEGGIGAGTRIRFRLTQGNRTQEVEGIVAEPDPGRVLTETYPASGMVTIFTIDTAVGGSHLLFETTWESRRGIAGIIERFLAPRLLTRLYAEELDLIERWATERNRKDS